HDPDLKLLDGLHLGRLSGQSNAQLFLSAGSAKEKDEFTRYFLGNSGAAILLDPGKSQIDPCGNTRGSVDVFVFDPYQFGCDLHCGISNSLLNLQWEVALFPLSRPASARPLSRRPRPVLSEQKSGSASMAPTVT